MRTTLVLLVCAMLMTVAVPGVQAAEAGASGQCSDGTNANDDDVRVNDSGPAGDLPGVVDLPNDADADGDSDGDTVEAVAALALPPGTPPTDNCASDDPPSDYIEVHVFTETGPGHDAQVCYDGFDGGTGVHTTATSGDGSPCRHDPDDSRALGTD